MNRTELPAGKTRFEIWSFGRFFPAFFLSKDSEGCLQGGREREKVPEPEAHSVAAADNNEFMPFIFIAREQAEVKSGMC